MLIVLTRRRVPYLVEARSGDDDGSVQDGTSLTIRFEEHGAGGIYDGVAEGEGSGSDSDGRDCDGQAVAVGQRR